MKKNHPTTVFTQQGCCGPSIELFGLPFTALQQRLFGFSCGMRKAMPIRTQT
jgi:hypothetical protein